MKARALAASIIAGIASSAFAQIDVHSHAVSAEYLEFIRQNNAEMDEGFPIPGWTESGHLAFMDEAGIVASVLTEPAPHPFFGDAEEAAKFCRSSNRAMAGIKAGSNGRFLFCATLPTPDVQKAVDEAVYALDILHADGVKLPTNSRGLYLGDPALDPLMEALNERNAVIIIHPHKPSSMNAKLMEDVPLASYEYLAETTRAVLNMVAHDVLARYRNVKVVVPHCGSFLANALPRFRALLPIMAAQGRMKEVDVDANLKGLYYDLAGAATDDVIRSLLAFADESRVMYGSDYPYVGADALVAAKASLEKRLPALGLDPVDVFSNNARRLFQMETREEASAVPGKARDDGAITVNLRYTGKDGAAMKFAKEMTEGGTVGKIRAEPGNLRYEYFVSLDDPETVLLIDSWGSQEAIDLHHETPMMKTIAELREKYDLTMAVERFSPGPAMPKTDEKHIRTSHEK